MPLIVKDPRGQLTAAPETPRTQLTSSVDVAPLLLTIATGSSDWRREPHYSHIAGRLDLARSSPTRRRPGARTCCTPPTRSLTEFAIEPYAADAPLHVVALRTPQAKYATYSNWHRRRSAATAHGQETELYDYSTHAGRLELDNVAGHSPLEEALRAEYAQALRDELRAPLPRRLIAAHARGFADYFSTAKHAAVSAAARRKRVSEHEAPAPQPPSSQFRRRPKA